MFVLLEAISQELNLQFSGELLKFLIISRARLLHLSLWCEKEKKNNKDQVIQTAHVLERYTLWQEKTFMLMHSALFSLQTEALL